MKDNSKIIFTYALFTAIAISSVIDITHSKFIIFFVFNFIMCFLTIQITWQKSDRNFSQIYNTPLKYSDLEIFNNYAGFEVQRDNIIQSESLSEFEYSEMVSNSRLKNILIKAVIIISYVAGLFFLVDAKLDILAQASIPVTLLVFITSLRYWGMWVLGLFVFLISFSVVFSFKSIFSYFIGIIFFILFFLNLAFLNNWYWKRLLKKNFQFTRAQLKSVLPSIVIFTTLFCLTDHLVENENSLFSKLIESLIQPVENKQVNDKKVLDLLNTEIDKEIETQLNKIPDLDLKDQNTLDQLNDLSRKMKTLEQRDFSFENDNKQYQSLLKQKTDLVKKAMAKHNPNGELKLNSKKLDELTQDINTEVKIKNERRKSLKLLEKEQRQRDIKLKKWLKRLAVFIGLLIIIYFLNQLMKKEKISKEDIELSDSQRNEIKKIIREKEPHFSNFNQEVDYKYKKAHALLKVLYFEEHNHAPPAMIVPIHDNLAKDNTIRILAAKLGVVFNAIHFASQKKFQRGQIKDFRHSYKTLISKVKRQI